LSSEILKQKARSMSCVRWLYLPPESTVLTKSDGSIFPRWCTLHTCKVATTCNDQCWARQQHNYCL